MSQVEIYALETVKIFQQISNTIEAAETDKNLLETERNEIKSFLQASKNKLAGSIIGLILLSQKHEEECVTQQSSTSQK